MPIYEYQCPVCGHEAEILQKINDQPIKKCPACGSNKFVKLVSAAGFQLKGTGWYVTDFRDKAKSEPKKEVASSDSAGENAPSAESSAIKQAGEGDSGSNTSKAGDTMKKDRDSSTSNKKDAESKKTSKARAASSDKKSD